MSADYPTSRIHPLDQKDIDELSLRIDQFKAGQEDEERFKHYRLTRGVYGQRQLGVQMFRIKIPYGRLTPEQLVRIADLSEEYTNGRLHLTTRQNIQLHYVRLKDSPAIWRGLAEVGLHAREACGNTVRTVTASATAGVHPEEAFDVSPYAQAVTDYFLRHPICQEMGRKVKIAFSGTERDAAFTYFHDFGFLACIQNGKRGFKVVVGGGLGAVSMVAQTVSAFMPTDEIIPFLEASLRVFDRYGERKKRMKARLKFLVKSMGLKAFLEMVEAEKKGLARQRMVIDPVLKEMDDWPVPGDHFQGIPDGGYDIWRQTNVFPQKQAGFVYVHLSVDLGNLTAQTARQLAQVVTTYAAPDIRITVNQGLHLRFVRPESLPALYMELAKLGLHAPGFHSTADVTACPGTDTCALGVTNSTGLANRLSDMIREDFPEYLHEQHLKIKISGCMNACGQHMAAEIGFHGSSIRDKEKNWLIPAMQVVLGGGVHPNGKGFIAEKIIKLPTRRVPQALSLLLEHYEDERREEEYFIDFVQRLGKRYFYDLLKPLAQTDTLTEADLIDWTQEKQYQQSIGVGECAGAAFDLVGTILQDALIKRKEAFAAYASAKWDFAAYHAYTALVVGAKALLLSVDVACNTHNKIISDFQTHFVDNQMVASVPDFPAFVLQIKEQEPTPEAVGAYLEVANGLLDEMVAHRKAELEKAGGDKLVLDQYYKA